jgi:hypothetical protein
MTAPQLAEALAGSIASDGDPGDLTTVIAALERLNRKGVVKKRGAVYYLSEVLQAREVEVIPERSVGPAIVRAAQRNPNGLTAAQIIEILQNDPSTAAHQSKHLYRNIREKSGARSTAKAISISRLKAPKRSRRRTTCPEHPPPRLSSTAMKEEAMPPPP